MQLGPYQENPRHSPFNNGVTQWLVPRELIKIVTEMVLYDVHSEARIPSMIFEIQTSHIELQPPQGATGVSRALSIPYSSGDAGIQSVTLYWQSIARFAGV